MKHIIRFNLIFLIFVMSFNSCQNAGRGLVTTVTGQSGEVLLLCSKSLYDGIVGDSIKAVFNDSQIGMPQNEPVMDLFQLNHESFSSMFKTHRSILEVKVSPSVQKTRLVVKNNMYVRTQAYMIIEATSNKEALRVIEENRVKILAYFLKSERDRKVEVISNASVQEIFDYLKENKQFMLSFPPGYKIAKTEPDFLWVRKETPQSSQGMFIYTYDYLSENAFDKNSILMKRNEMLKALVPGQNENSYMSTEVNNFPIYCNYYEFKGNYAVETRGLWKVIGDFMGGPFVNLSFLDAENNRVICMDAYVYHPNKNKRELLRELEAIMHTYKPISKEAE